MRASAILGATILLMSLLAGTTLAKPPKYDGHAPANPGTVTFGKLVRFDVDWTNQSGANLPTVNVKAITAAFDKGAEFVDLLAGPTVNDVAQGQCQTQTAALLECSFGTVTNLSTVRFSVLYNVPDSGTFSQIFNFTAQGFSTNDPHNSRGDDMPVTGTVTLVSANSDQAGSYIVDGTVDVVETNPSLNKRNNPQSSKLDFSGSTEDNFGATVSESATTACPSGITTCYGQLIVMNAKSGLPIGGGFLATAGYVSVPGSATGTFIHWLHDSATGDVEGVDYEIIDQSCADVAAGTSCIADTFKTNGNTFYVIQLYSNGPMRGI